MSHRRRSEQARSAARPDDDIFKRRPTTVKSRRRPDGRWELLHPTAALELAEDLEEVQTMRAAGEKDVAVDELRWLLSECHDSIEAHYLLGEMAFEDEDWRLARAHFGHAFDLGYAALPVGGVGGKLSYELPANQPLMQAAKGLAFCLYELERGKTALAVLEVLASWDAADPLGAAALATKWTADIAAATGAPPTDAAPEDEDAEDDAHEGEDDDGDPEA